MVFTAKNSLIHNWSKTSGLRQEKALEVSHVFGKEGVSHVLEDGSDVCGHEKTIHRLVHHLVVRTTITTIKKLFIKNNKNRDVVCVDRRRRDL